MFTSDLKFEVILHFVEDYDVNPLLVKRNVQV